jgi:hypothetical protein
METQRVSHLDSNWELTELPNGACVVSSHALRRDTGFKRNYEILIAGGRLADIESPGAGLAFANALPIFLEQEYGRRTGEEAFSCTMHHSYFCLNYMHHGRDQHDAKCLELILNTIMHEFPSRVTFEELPRIEIGNRRCDVEAFWCWFYSRTAPDYQRLCIPSWTETMLSWESGQDACTELKNKLVIPANIMVRSSEPCLHEDLAERISELNAVDANAEKYVCPQSAIYPIIDEYPMARILSDKQDLLLFFPLANDRCTYYKAVLALHALYGKKGYLKELNRGKKPSLNPEIYACFWPQPFAFIRLCTAKQNSDKALDLIALTLIKFSDLPAPKKIWYYKAVVEDVARKYAEAGEFLRDEWLRGQTELMGLEKLEVTLENLEYTQREYLSESRMGLIRGVPFIPKHESLFDVI